MAAEPKGLAGAQGSAPDGQPASVSDPMPRAAPGAAAHSPGWAKQVGSTLILLALLAVALALRLYGLNWDRGLFFHPDERQILMVAAALSWPRDLLTLLTPESSWNPHFFAYGSFPIYLLRLVSAALGSLRAEWTTLAASALMGRVISALFDTLAVLATYWLGRKVAGRRVGLLAAAFVTFTVLHIQLSRFYAVDTIATALVLLAVNKAIDVARHGRARDGLWLGLLLGVALATKVSVLPLALTAVVAWLAFAWSGRGSGRVAMGEEQLAQPRSAPLSIWGVMTLVGRRLLAAYREVRRRPRPSLLSILDPERVGRTLWARARRGVSLTFGAAALGFVLLQPYALIDAYSFVLGIGQEIGMAQGWYDFPYTRQYAGTWGYLYQMRQILLFAMGPSLGLLGMAGLLWLCVRVWRRPWGEGLVLLAWPVPYVLMQGTTYAKFIRYTLPLLPFLCLAGAWLWVHGWDGIRQALKSLAEGDKCPQTLEEGECVLGEGNPRSLGSGPIRWPRRRMRCAQTALVMLLCLVLGGTVFYAVAFINVYRQTHPWLTASSWLCQHIEEGSSLLVEYWDDPLPVDASAERKLCPPYQSITVDFHAPDSEDKLGLLLDALEKCDFIVLSSQRLYAPLTRLEQMFPISSRYYQALFGGELGFELVAAPAVYPSWLGIALRDNPRAGLGLPEPALLSQGRPAGRVIDLGPADESFTVYDHPQPLVFARVHNLTRDELQALVQP